MEGTEKKMGPMSENPGTLQHSGVKVVSGEMAKISRRAYTNLRTLF